MFAEEEYLRRKFGEGYLAWSLRTPAFFPRPGNWRPPSRFVNWLAGIGSEYSTVFLVVVLFSILDLLEDRIMEGHFSVDGMWAPIFSVTAILYLIVLVLKKKTKILNKK